MSEAGLHPDGLPELATGERNVSARWTLNLKLCTFVDGRRQSP